MGHTDAGQQQHHQQQQQQQGQQHHHQQQGEGPAGSGWLKGLLKQVNAHLRREQPVFGPAEVRLKIERGNGFAKNFMRLCNKTMIGLNRIHVSRGKVFAGFLGMGMGWLCATGEEAVEAVNREYLPAFSRALVEQVLRSDPIKEALNHTLLHNVYTNPEVQYSLHELLDWKVIRPQMPSLQALSKQALLEALANPNLIARLSAATGEAAYAQRTAISGATLDFLEGEQLRGIVRREIGGFFRSKTFYELLATEFTTNLRSGLGSVENREKLYHFVKENFLNV